MDKEKCPHCGGYELHEEEDENYGKTYHCNDCGIRWPISGNLILKPELCGNTDHQETETVTKQDYCIITLMDGTSVTHCCGCGQIFATDKVLNIYELELPDTALTDVEKSLVGQVSSSSTAEFIELLGIDKHIGLSVLDAVLSFDDEQYFPIKMIVQLVPGNDIIQDGQRIKGVNIRFIGLLNSTMVNSDESDEKVPLLSNFINVVETPHNKHALEVFFQTVHDIAESKNSDFA